MSAPSLKFQRAGPDDFRDRAADRLADTRVRRQIHLFAYKLVDAFRKRSNFGCGSLVCLDFVWILPLRRKQLREACQTIRNLSVAQAMCVIRDCDPACSCAPLSFRQVAFAAGEATRLVCYLRASTRS